MAPRNTLSLSLWVDAGHGSVPGGRSLDRRGNYIATNKYDKNETFKQMAPLSSTKKLIERQSQQETSTRKTNTNLGFRYGTGESIATDCMVFRKEERGNYDNFMDK